MSLLEQPTQVDPVVSVINGTPVTRAEQTSELAELQRRFWRLLVAPQGVASALPELEAEGDAAAKPEQWIVAADRDEAIWRLDIYADMYFFRLLDLLRDDYPTLAALLGEARFHNLITDYLVAHPPRHASVRHAGAALPGYLSDHELLARFPAAAELARLEWTQSLLVDREDCAPLSAEQLQTLPPERWPELPLAPVTAFSLLELEYPVHRLWRAATDGEALPELEREKTCVAVWRRGFVVHHRTVDANEAAALAALGEGETAGLPFAALCEALAETHGEEHAAQHAVAHLRRWITDEMLRDTLAPASV